jgi:hypothetical protein
MLRITLQVMKNYLHGVNRPATKTSTGRPNLSYRKPVTRSHLRRLSPEIEIIRQEARALLQPSPCWTSLSEERLAMRTQIKSELQRLAQQSSEKHTDETAPGHLCDQWFMQDLLWTMRSFDNFFLLSYQIDPTKPLSETLLPLHVKEMKKAIRDVFSCASGEDWRKLLKVTDPSVLEWAEITPPAWAKSTKDNAATGGKLNLDEFIALVDYLQPDTHHFFIANGGVRLDKFWGVEGIREAGSNFHNAYLSALAKLSNQPDFIDCSGLYFKGLIAHGHMAAMSTMINFLSERQALVMPPHPISTTKYSEESFRMKAGRMEETEIIFRVQQGIDVSPFHGSRGKCLGEIILLPQQLKFAPIEKINGLMQQEHTYLLETADKSLHGSNKSFNLENNSKKNPVSEVL